MSKIFDPIHTYIAKPSAVTMLAAMFEGQKIDPYFSDVFGFLQSAINQLGRPRNQEIKPVSPELAQDARVGLVAKGLNNVLGTPTYLNGRPSSFPPFDSSWPNMTPDLDMITISKGYFCLIPDAPVVFDQARQVVTKFSSKFASLLYFYDCSVASMLGEAIFINGTALSIIDDVYDLNYCHWICDWVTRLAPFKERLSQPDFYVLVSPIFKDWQLRTLELCGIERHRIISVAPWHAVKARELIVLSDISNIMHPAQKGADWALSFLRNVLASATKPESYQLPANKCKIYISRSDASGRRIENEHEFYPYLARYGYERIVLSEMSFDEQVAKFSNASHIISIHGAGLTNIAFCDSGTNVLEIFPHSYGTPAFCVLALANAMNYSAYICTQILENSRNQLDDIHLDLNDFIEKCTHLI